MIWSNQLKARWLALAAREQRALGFAAAVVAMALVWGVLLSPALRTLKGAAVQHAQLDAELERMQALQLRAGQLQSKPAVAPQDSLKALQAVATQIGKGASLLQTGDRATLSLQQISAANLASLLTPASAAGLSPIEAHLRRSADAGEPLWSGTLVFRLQSATSP